MIYETKERAEEVAAELNQRYGHPPARAVLTPDGWTVIAAWEPPHYVSIEHQGGAQSLRLPFQIRCF